GSGRPGAVVRTNTIVPTTLPIQVTAKGGIDQNGKIYVLAQDKADVLSGKKPAEPLAIRANIGDCVAVTLSSELPNASQFGGFSKVNIHIHHVQFDTQVSDGVISGMSFEQSIRPYKEAPEESQLTSAAAPG